MLRVLDHHDPEQLRLSDDSFWYRIAGSLLIIVSIVVAVATLMPAAEQRSDTSAWVRIFIVGCTTAMCGAGFGIALNTTETELDRRLSLIIVKERLWWWRRTRSRPFGEVESIRVANTGGRHKTWGLVLLFNARDGVEQLALGFGLSREQAEELGQLVSEFGDFPRTDAH